MNLVKKINKLLLVVLLVTLSVFLVKPTIKCFHKRTVYGNLYVKGSKSVEDVKIFIKDKFSPNNWGKFLSCDDMGFYRLLDFIRSKFPDKSEYEI